MQMSCKWSAMRCIMRHFFYVELDCISSQTARFVHSDAMKSVDVDANLKSQKHPIICCWLILWACAPNRAEVLQESNEFNPNHVKKIEQLMSNHCSDFIRGLRRLISPTIRMFFNSFFGHNNKRSIKALYRRAFMRRIRNGLPSQTFRVAEYFSMSKRHLEYTLGYCVCACHR